MAGRTTPTRCCNRSESPPTFLGCPAWCRRAATGLRTALATRVLMGVRCMALAFTAAFTDHRSMVQVSMGRLYMVRDFMGPARCSSIACRCTGPTDRIGLRTSTTVLPSLRAALLMALGHREPLERCVRALELE